MSHLLCEHRVHIGEQSAIISSDFPRGGGNLDRGQGKTWRGERGENDGIGNGIFDLILQNTLRLKNYLKTRSDTGGASLFN